MPATVEQRRVRPASEPLLATVPARFPGAQKANALMGDALAAGWTASAKTEPPSTVAVTLTKGEQKITVTFVDGKLDLERMPTLSRPDRRDVQLKDVSAAKKIISSPVA